jgi:hypothetical protein
MLSKCANPTCPTTSRCIHEGRLYVIDPREVLAGHKPRFSSNSGQLECAWLCSACSLYLTIQIEEEVRKRTVGQPGAKHGSDVGTPANHRVNLDIA